MKDIMTAQPETRDSKGASVISNVIDVLRCFSIEEPLQGVTEIAVQVGLHKSTVSRILATLENENIVERDPLSRRFRLGLGIITLAGPLLADLDVRKVAHPVLQELSRETGETAALVLWNETESISVEQVVSRSNVKHTSPLGTSYGTALSASVQVFLALEEEDRVRQLLGSGTIQHPSPNSKGLEAYLTRLGDVRSRGYAVNFGETSVEEVGIAVPVHDHRGDVAAAVLISAPRFRVDKDQLEVLVSACVLAAKDITRRLGGRPPVDAGLPQGADSTAG